MRGSSAQSSSPSRAGAPAADRHGRGPRLAAGGGEDRAEQDQHEADRGGDREGLVQDQHAEQHRDGRVDVGDHGRAGRPDLGDQLEEDQERDRRADHREDQHGEHRLAGRPARRRLDQPGRHVRQRGQRQRRRHHAEGRQVGQRAGEDERADRVADHHHRDRDDRAGVAGADLEADQRGDPGQPDQQAEQPAAAEPLPLRAEPGEQRADQRDAGHQQAGQRAGQALLGEAEQEPRRADLDRGVEQQRPPAAQHRADQPAGQRHREQQHGGHRGPGQHQGGRRDLVDRDLDQQVRNAPDDRHRDEEHPPTAAHDDHRSSRLGQRPRSWTSAGGRMFPVVAARSRHPGRPPAIRAARPRRSPCRRSPRR